MKKQNNCPAWADVELAEATKQLHISAAKELAGRATRNKELLQEVIAEMKDRGPEYWHRIQGGNRANVKAIMNEIGREILEKRK